MNNDIRYLHSFIAVAEYLNFTKAAEHLHISQSALSKHIIELEEQLGVQLFIRNHSMVCLTRAGFTLFKEAGNLLKKIDEVLEATRQSQNDVSGKLKIGCPSSSHTFLPKIFKRFSALYPHITLELRVLQMPISNNQLYLEELDINFNSCIGHTEKLKSPFKQKEIRRSRLCFLLPINHTYANKYSISLYELKQERFILFDQPGFEFSNWFVRKCNEQGFTPNIAHAFSEVDSIFLHVASGLGISFFVLDSLYCKMLRSQISVVAMNGDDAYGIVSAVWNTKNKNPAISLFLNSIN
ncbi:LysR family transcriptional regulator [Sporomusa sp. KB1]|jgi:DNA-binding transcriptional LysR family regulator|uniref:LysR family transcriptional regulator n=1 Tax=Sporomusa sp. KB1 TaxID=943346 RepID=UPI00119D1E86|nr:LysR family transcriptional regulator [Sporomusa sp. KB1]TWH45420.1 DNA-binding transcriptional LysR family regulator [Sporomusa sp. KB1]